MSFIIAFDIGTVSLEFIMLNCDETLDFLVKGKIELVFVTFVAHDS